MDVQRYRAAEQRLWASKGAQPTERMVRPSGLDGSLRVQEVGVGEPVLYLHGGPNAGTTWAPLVGRLSGVRSLLVDRPGTGLSEPFDINTDNLVGVADFFVADVLDALGLERAHVVASSFGGFVALRSAAASPDRIGVMVQMGCPAGAPDIGLPMFMKALVAPGLGRLIHAMPPTTRANRAIFRQIGHGKSLDTGRIPQEFWDWYLAMQRHTDTMANESRLISSLASLGGWDPALQLDDDLLADVSVPTLFLWGADDPFAGEPSARRMVAAMPDATLEMLPDAGHLPWLDHPESAAGSLRKFIAAHPLDDVAETKSGMMP